MGGEEGATYSVIADIGTVSGVGMDFISGYAFLQRYYTVVSTRVRVCIYSRWLMTCLIPVRHN